jgi:hypothetical protein
MIPWLWQSTKGYRLRPWRSPFLRWRMETYWGLHAEKITGKEFRAFAWEHRADLLRFLKWASEMRQLTRGGQ